MALSLNHRSWSQFLLSSHAALLLFGLIGVAVLSYLILEDQVRLAVAITAATILITLATVRIRLAIVATLVFLILLGDLRRVLIPFVGWSGIDPLLVVGPAFAIVLTGYAWASGAISVDSPAARWILVLMAIMLVQIFNPRQGGLIVGVVGIMFQLIPLFWFWIGRAYATRPFLQTLLFRVMLGLSGLAMLFGLYQSFFGYLPYQMQWYNIAGYGALGNPEKGLSPITFFASNTEHGVFVSLGIILLWSLALFKNRSALLLIPVFLAALLITGIRGPVAKTLIMMAGLWAIIGRSMFTWLTRGALALLLAGLGLFWSLSGITQSLSNAPPQVQHRLERQAKEFVYAPTEGKEKSSTVNHLGMLVYGYRLGISTPLGIGLGAGTKASMKFGGGGSTETDLGDSFRALGIPGGVAYHIVVFLLIISAFRFWRQDRSPLSMAILGFMGIAFLQWLSSKYGVTPLLWFCLGAMDKLQRQRAEKTT